MNHNFLIGLFVLLTSFFVHAKEAAIYNGPGACDGCALAIQKILEPMGFKVRLVSPKDIDAKLFQKIVLFVQPGGSDRLMDTLEVMPASKITELQKFVHKGGRYLGVCAGAYLAGERAIDIGSKTVKAYNLVPGTMDEEIHETKAQILNFIWKGNTVPLYFQDGPNLDKVELADVQVWATFEKSGHKAAIIAKSGLGFVGLISPHPEATRDWFEEDKLPIPNQYHADLGKAFFEELMKAKP